MSEHEREHAAEPRITGDPDFTDVARERTRGPADYDESAGNELRPAEPAPERKEIEAGEEDEPVFPDED